MTGFLLLAALPWVLLPVALLSLWLGSERWRLRFGRPLARAVGWLAGAQAAVVGLLWVTSLGSAMSSLGNFTQSMTVAFWAVMNVIVLVTAWRAARRGAAGPWGVAASLPLALLVFVMVSAAGLDRPRPSQNEAATVGDVRSLISAEQSYAGLNHGFFDKPACLAKGAACLPGAPPNPDPMLSEPDLVEVRNGYRRTFHAGPAAPSGEVKRLHASRTSLTAFAYVAVPTEPGRTGFQAFCGASDGSVCTRSGGTMPAPIDGKCPADCVPFR